MSPQATMLLLIFMTLLIVFSFYIEMLYTELDGGAPRVTLLDMLSPGSRQVALFMVTVTSVLQQNTSHQQGHTREAA